MLSAQASWVDSRKTMPLKGDEDFQYNFQSIRANGLEALLRLTNR